MDLSLPGRFLCVGYALTGSATVWLVIGAAPHGTRYGPTDWTFASEDPGSFYTFISILLAIGLPCVITGHTLQVRERIRRAYVTKTERFERAVRIKLASIFSGLILLQVAAGCTLYEIGVHLQWSMTAVSWFVLLLLVANVIFMLQMFRMRYKIWRRPTKLQLAN